MYETLPQAMGEIVEAASGKLFLPSKNCGYNIHKQKKLELFLRFKICSDFKQPKKAVMKKTTTKEPMNTLPFCFTYTRTHRSCFKVYFAISGFEPFLPLELSFVFFLGGLHGFDDVLVVSFRKFSSMLILWH